MPLGRPKKLRGVLELNRMHQHLVYADVVNFMFSQQ